MLGLDKMGGDKPSEKGTESRMKVDPSKAYGMFAHNMPRAASQPIGK